MEIISTATGLTRSETCYEVSESGKVVREVNDKKSTYNPSISIDGVSVSLSNTLQMVLMNPNPYVSCKVN